MSIYEYNEEYVKRTLLEDGMKAGYDKGKADGLLEGEIRGRTETLVKSVEAVMKSLQTDAVKACEILGISTAEYEKAKKETGSLPFS